MRKRMTGFSMVEVLISILLITIVGVAALRTYMMSMKMAYIENIRTTAVYRCQEVVEQALADNFENVDVENYPDRTGLVLDSRGTYESQDDVLFDQTFQIVDQSFGGRQEKDFTVTISFDLAGERYSEQITTRIVGASR